ncbi:MAG: phosphatidate cytidylyltransferase [Gemmatimonadota bacterium]
MAGGELARRWAVALVGIPIIVVVLYAGSWPLAIVLAVMAGIATDECYRLVRRQGLLPVAWLGVPAGMGLVMFAALAPGLEGFALGALGLLAAVTLSTLMVVTFARPPEGKPLATAATTVFGALYGGLSLAVIPLLHAFPFLTAWAGLPASPWAGVAMVALPLTATWVGDATAFFAGSAWGQRRLAPSISPNKSWEGAIAGVLGAGLGAALWYAVVRGVLPGAPLSFVSSALLGSVLGVAAIVGDLVESMLKRDAGVKDSGTLLPGHGGVLDRIDALIFSLPVAYLLLRILEAIG